MAARRPIISTCGTATSERTAPSRGAQGRLRLPRRGQCILAAVSLTDLSLTLWQHPKMPVAALVAQYAARLSLEKIDEARRDAFDASLTALIGWWPERRKRSLREVWDEAHAEPMRVRDELKGVPRRAADVCVRALYLQASNLERSGRGRRELPPDCYTVEQGDFESLLRDAIRLHRHTQVRDLVRRMTVLEELASKRTWSDVVSAAEQMGWTRLQPGIRKLAPRLRDLAEALDAGATAEITEMGGRAALRVTMIAGTRRVGVLSDDEMQALRAVVPWIPGAEAGSP